MIVVFDLDGTLALIEHRRHFVDGRNGKKDWPAFYRACIDDEPNWPVIRILEAMDRVGHIVHIWSGRSDEVRAETQAWLEKHLTRIVRVPKVRMRKAGDYTPDDVMKEAWLKAEPQWAWPQLAFDDRQRVVDMWRRNGILCCQVAPGDF